jgi:hypothetical protein
MPITIGPFTNVPAPGDPIKSDWPQSISNYLWGRYPRGYIGHAYGPSTDTAHTSGQPIPGMSITWNAKSGRTYLTIINVSIIAGTAGAVIDASVADANNAGTITTIAHCPGANNAVGMTVLDIFTAGADATATRKALASVNTGTITIAGSFGRRGFITVLDIGTGTPIT